MPRDANGNYTLPTENPVQTETVITSTWANSTMQDLAAEITDSLSRSGKGGITGPLQIIDEQGGIPGLAFANEPTSGLKRAGTGDVRIQVIGNDRLRCRSGVAQPPEMQINAVWEELVSKERLAIPSANNAMSGVDAETKVWFYSVIPAGWEAAPPDANIRELVVGTVVQTGGSSDPRTLTDTVTINFPAATSNHTLTANQSGLPGHTHNLQIRQGLGFSTIPQTAAAGTAATAVTDGITGGSQSASQGHSHNIGGSGNDTVDITPRYAEGLIGVMSAA